MAKSINNMNNTINSFEDVFLTKEVKKIKLINKINTNLKLFLENLFQSK